MTAYCVKCKKKTADVNPVQTTMSSGRPMEKSQCATCGTTKCRILPGKMPAGFKVVKKKKGKGIFGDIVGSIF